MARILEFSDGAERGDVSWWTWGEINTDTLNAIHGTYCYRFQGYPKQGYKAISNPLSDFYFRCYVKFTAGGSDPFHFRSGGNVLLTFTQNPASSRLDITGSVTGNTPNNSLTFGWQCLEIHYKINNTTGILTIRLDGVEVFTFSGDTQTGSYTTVDNFYFGYNFTSGLYLDDFALDDADWCGLGYYLPLVVNSNGNINQWTSSSGNPNYQNVDEIPSSDIDYNSSTTSGQVDEYNLTTVSLTNLVVQRIISFARVKNPAGGTLKAGILTHSTPYTNTLPVPTSFTTIPTGEYLVNPNTGIAWTQSELDDLQLYVEVV